MVRTKEEVRTLRQKMRDVNIVFEGPVPPKKWPPGHKNLFEIIREISVNRLDQCEDQLKPKERRARHKRIQDLTTKARELRLEIDINEDTWRSDIESAIFERFGKEIVWQVLPNKLCSSRAHSITADVVRVRYGLPNMLPSQKVMTSKLNCIKRNNFVLYANAGRLVNRTIALLKMGAMACFLPG
jgi:hypothetical protein